MHQFQTWIPLTFSIDTNECLQRIQKIAISTYTHFSMWAMSVGSPLNSFPMCHIFMHPNNLIDNISPKSTSSPLKKKRNTHQPCPHLSTLHCHRGDIDHHFTSCAIPFSRSTQSLSLMNTNPSFTHGIEEHTHIITPLSTNLVDTLLEKLLCLHFHSILGQVDT